MSATEYSENLGGVLGFVRDIAGQGLDYYTSARRAEAETAAYVSAIQWEDARNNANANQDAGRTVFTRSPLMWGAVAIVVLVLVLRK